MYKLFDLLYPEQEPLKLPDCNNTCACSTRYVVNRYAKRKKVGKQSIMCNITVMRFLLNVISKEVHSWEYCKLSGLKNPWGETLCIENDERSFCDPQKHWHEYKVAHMPLTKKFKRIVLGLHNYYRNKLAGGDEISKGTGTKYGAATRMRALIWDNKLEYNAKLHLDAAKKMQHDNCRNTKRYVLAGQNWITDCATGEQGKVNVFGVIADNLRLMYLEKDILSETKQLPDSLRREDMTSLLTKFRIKYSELIMLKGLTELPKPETLLKHNHFIDHYNSNVANEYGRTFFRSGFDSLCLCQARYY
uniref:SCP domain-containing protein n=1 Tax=Glossina brevipalpis TaxID=37001 RepID=A0A1A9WSK1_9MUSC